MMKIAVIMAYVGICGLYYVGIFTYCSVTELGLSVGAVIRDEQGTGLFYRVGQKSVYIRWT